MRSIVALFVVLVSGIAANVASAQNSLRRTPHEGFATRAELESLVVQAELSVATGARSGAEQSVNKATAFILRQRLADGDFRPGDRIAVVLAGAVKLNDTLVVRSGRTITLPDLPEISLAGVLRSELQSYLAGELSRYIREPQLQTRPLVRLMVSGAVTRPGFYSVPADALLSDVVTTAGGPSGKVAFEKSNIRRGDEVLWNGQSVQAALIDGLTVDALFLRSGDELVIKEAKSRNYLSIVQMAATLGGLASVIVVLAR